MDLQDQILQDVPLFTHCTDAEIIQLKKIGRIAEVRSGQQLDLKKINSLNVIMSGIFEIEASGKNDIVYLSPGSFFGDIPFTVQKQKGLVRAITDSTMMFFDAEDLYRFFLETYRGLRGFIRSADRMGFEISDAGRSYFGNKSKIIAVYSPTPDAGKSLFAASLGQSLAGQAQTAIMDLSYTGQSLFDLFEKKITPAFSQKQVDRSRADQLIGERMESVDPNLSLINFSFGSKVRVDPAILPMLLFLLSRRFKYIVLDLSDFDEDLRDKAFEVSDIVFVMLRRVRDRGPLYPLLDEKLREGQRVYYVLNRHYAEKVRHMEGGLLLDRLERSAGESPSAFLKKLAEKNVLAEFVGIVTARRRGLVLEANLQEAVIYSGLLKALSGHGIHFDLYYSSSFSFLMISLFLLAGSGDDFERSVEHFFSESRINGLLDITFPEEFVFGNDRIAKFAGELAGDHRVETFRNLPVAMLASGEGLVRRLFSTGHFRDLIGASFLLPPLFDSLKISGDSYSSGFPVKRARVEDLFRTDIDEVVCAAARSRSRLKFQPGRLLRFYERYIGYADHFSAGGLMKNAADKNIRIEIEEKELKVKKIMKLSEEITNKWLKENRITP